MIKLIQVSLNVRILNSTSTNSGLRSCMFSKMCMPFRYEITKTKPQSAQSCNFNSSKLKQNPWKVKQKCRNQRKIVLMMRIFNYSHYTRIYICIYICIYIICCSCLLLVLLLPQLAILKIAKKPF